MADYILTKTQKGAKYQYQVIDTKTKKIISKRLSARNYVASTANGEFYFGRIDLIGKGDHGKRLNMALLILNNPRKAYNDRLAYYAPSFRREWAKENPFEKWIEEHKEWAQQIKNELEKIAYLTDNK